MKTAPNYLIIKVENLYEDKVTLKGGATLEIDTSWQPDLHRPESATVIAVPDVLTDEITLYKNHLNHPIALDSFPMEAKVGDEVVCDWTMFSEEMSFGEEVLVDNFFKVRYDLLYALLRREEGRVNVIPLCDYVLLSPYWGEDVERVDDILVRRRNGVIVETNPLPLNNTARVMFSREGSEYRMGDLVLVNTDWLTEISIEGKQYLAVREHEILGKYI